jgi:hypothetical protein
MPIEPAQLASSLGTLGSLDVERGLAVMLPQVLHSAKTLLDADRAVLMLVDRTGALRWVTTPRVWDDSEAAAARGRIIDAESGRRRADQAP